MAHWNWNVPCQQTAQWIAKFSSETDDIRHLMNDFTCITRENDNTLDRLDLMRYSIEINFAACFYCF
jgi:hypothetical protein